MDQETGQGRSIERGEEVVDHFVVPLTKVRCRPVNVDLLLGLDISVVPTGVSYVMSLVQDQGRLGSHARYMYILLLLVVLRGKLS